MPLKLKRRDGSVTPFRNAEYIPFYYLIPKSYFQRSGSELRSIPRNPQEIFHNRAACEFIESDLFKLFIIDATAHMVWRYMGFKEYMEIYSGYDPAWRLAHNPDYWIKELTDEGNPNLKTLLKASFQICFTVPTAGASCGFTLTPKIRTSTFSVARTM